MCARPFPAAFPQQVSSIFIMNSLLINCRLFKINSYNLTECWCLCVLSPPALDVRPSRSLGWGRWWGAIPVPSPSRNSLKDVAHPCLAVIVLHPLWSLWVSMQAQLRVCLSWEKPCPGQREQGDAVTPELLFLISLLPFIEPQPSAQSRMEGEQLLPFHGWEGQEPGRSG